ncbi:MAG: hypothetical protein JNM12_13240 [Alphaproteobacteria bacterium]|nr:hypothetical protein [Alphaproteobacteria bacterium]
MRSLFVILFLILISASQSHATQYHIDNSLIDEPFTIKVSNTFFTFPENTVRGGMTKTAYNSYLAFVIVQDSQDFYIAIQQRDEFQQNARGLTSMPLVDDLLFRTDAPANKVENIKLFLLSAISKEPLSYLEADIQLGAALQPKRHCPGIYQRDPECKEFYEDSTPTYDQVKTAATHKSKFFRTQASRALSEKFSQESGAELLMIHLLKDPKLAVRRNAVRYIKPFLGNNEIVNQVKYLAMSDDDKEVWNSATDTLGNNVPNLVYYFVGHINPEDSKSTMRAASFLCRLVLKAKINGDFKWWKNPSDEVKLAILGLIHIFTFAEEKETIGYAQSTFGHLQKWSDFDSLESFVNEQTSSSNLELQTYAQKILPMLKVKEANGQK